jgi:serine/threonine-protein kinase HipA
LIGNLDDHLRNHGFLYDREDKWRLSPAYDLNPVPSEEKVRELTTWISDEGQDADLDIAVRAAPFFALKGDQAEAIIRKVSAALKGWQNRARQLGMSAADIAVYSTAIQCD